MASGLDNLSFWWNTFNYASKVSAFFARGRSVEVAKFLLDQGASLSARFSKSEYLYFYILESSSLVICLLSCLWNLVTLLDRIGENILYKKSKYLWKNRQTSQDGVGRHGGALRCQARSSLHAQVRWNYHSVYITCSSKTKFQSYNWKNISQQGSRFIRLHQISSVHYSGHKFRISSKSDKKFW